MPKPKSPIDTAPGFTPGYVERFDTLTLFGRRWYFRVRAANHEKLAVSEGYNSPGARDRGLAVTRAAFIFGRESDS